MISTLAKQIKGYKKETILTPVFVSLEVFLDILIPFFMSKMVDEGITPSNIDNVIRYGSLMLIIAILALFCGAMSGRYAAIAAAGFGKNLRAAEFKNIQNFSFMNIDEYSTGGLITRLTTDVNNVQNSFQNADPYCGPLSFELYHGIMHGFLFELENCLLVTRRPCLPCFIYWCVN